ncbi:MAG: dihydrofolate reductase [Sediminibacterium sp.]|nr:dihydrofolate reductase [Sediminibacterium sp.]
MIKIKAIVAVSTNGVIGNQGKLIWKIPADLKFFKNTTYGLPLLMGRKTFELELKSTCLPGRKNLVISKQNNFNVGKAIPVKTIDEALEWCSSNDYKELIIVGGGQIYNEFLPLCHEIYVTRVMADFEGDTFFSIPSYFIQTQNRPYDAGPLSPYQLFFQTWINTKLID